MAADNARQAAEAAEFRQKLDTMVAAAADAKKYDAARARVLAATALLEEERAAAALAEKARVAAALIEPPSPMPTPPPPVTLLRRTTTTRPLSSPTSTSRPSTCSFSHLDHAGPLLILGLCPVA
jgi:hypothetical protein